MRRGRATEFAGALGATPASVPGVKRSKKNMIGTSTQRRTESAPLLLCFILAVLMSACLLLAAGPAHAATTFSVNSSADRNDPTPGDGKCFTGNFLVVGKECTLRAAIQEANAFPGADTIDFDIPRTGAAIISPGSELPTISKPVTIDGYTQGDARKNTETQPGKTNAVVKIELNGTSAVTNADGLVIDTSNVVVKGLVINRFSIAGIYLSGGTGHKLEGDFLGTDPSGTTAADGNGYGVNVFNTDGSTIGGTTPEARNLSPATITSALPPTACG